VALGSASVTDSDELIAFVVEVLAGMESIKTVSPRLENSKRSQASLAHPNRGKFASPSGQCRKRSIMDEAVIRDPLKSFVLLTLVSAHKNSALLT